MVSSTRSSFNQTDSMTRLPCASMLSNGATAAPTLPAKRTWKKHTAICKKGAMRHEQRQIAKGTDVPDVHDTRSCPASYEVATCRPRGLCTQAICQHTPRHHRQRPDCTCGYKGSASIVQVQKAIRRCLRPLGLRISVATRCTVLTTCTWLYTHADKIACGCRLGWTERKRAQISALTAPPAAHPKLPIVKNADLVACSACTDEDTSSKREDAIDPTIKLQHWNHKLSVSIRIVPTKS